MCDYCEQFNQKLNLFIKDSWKNITENEYYIKVWDEFSPKFFFQKWDEGLNKPKTEYDEHSKITELEKLLRRDSQLNSNSSERFEFLKVLFVTTDKEAQRIITNSRNEHQLVKTFLAHYENYQRNHRTTLTRALLATSKRKKTQFLHFHACIRNIKRPIIKQEQNENLTQIKIEIPNQLVQKLINNKVKSKLEKIKNNEVINQTEFNEYLEAGLWHCFNWILFERKIIEEMLQFSNLILSEEFVTIKVEPIINQSQKNILLEACRLIQGIIINLLFACDHLEIHKKTLDINIQQLSQFETYSFFSKVGNLSEDFSIKSYLDLTSGISIVNDAIVEPYRDTPGKLENLINYFKYALQNEYFQASFNSKNEKLVNKSFLEFVKLISEAKGDSEKKFLRACAAIIRFASTYRPIAVHEGKEQQLHFIIGFSDLCKSLYSQFAVFKDNSFKIPLIALRESKGKVEDIANLNILPKKISQARSEIKSVSNVLDSSQMAIFVDTNSVKDLALNQVSRQDDSYVNCPTILKFEPPIYQYPNANGFADTINDKLLAMVSITGRKRIDFIYKLQTILSWTDHLSVWEETNTWTIDKLKSVLKRILGVASDFDIKLNKFLNVCFAISKSPHEGASIVIINGKSVINGDNFDLVFNSDLKTLNGKVQPMTDKEIHKLNFLNNVSQESDDVIFKMLTLDGGSVYDFQSNRLWVRRKLLGPDDFGPAKVKKVTNKVDLEVTMESLWDSQSIIDSNYNYKTVHWRDWFKYKEWGTRHQASLSFSSLMLGNVKMIISEEENNDRPYYLITRNIPEYIVLVVSADGDITLMHNGRVINPENQSQ